MLAEPIRRQLKVPLVMAGMISVEWQTERCLSHMSAVEWCTPIPNTVKHRVIYYCLH